MSYFLSKFLPLFVYPLGLSIGLGLAALSTVRRRRRLASGMMLLGLSVLWLCSMPMFSRYLITGLEAEIPSIPFEKLPRADAIVVLGGIAAATPIGEEPDFGEAIDRLFLGLRLYQSGKAPVIILSGGAAEGYIPEARILAELLQMMGVPRRALVLESRSRNTYQNAQYVKQVLASRQMQHLLLVTSAIHMRRAYAVFRAAGLPVIPVASGFHQADDFAYSIISLLPDARALFNTTKALKEYLGWWVYRWRGWL